MDLAVEAFRKSQHLVVWRSQVLTLKIQSRQLTFDISEALSDEFVLLMRTSSNLERHIVRLTLSPARNAALPSIPLAGQTKGLSKIRCQ